MATGNPLAQLGYIEGRIGNTYENAIKTNIMLDSGCTNSVISVPFFTKAIASLRIDYHKLETPIDMITASQTNIHLTHACDLPIWFKDALGEIGKIEYRFMVATQIPQDMILGVDFFTSQYFKAWTNNELHITTDKGEVRNKITYRNDDICNNLLIAEHKPIPPHTLVELQAAPQFPDKIPKYDFPNDLVTCINVDQPSPPTDYTIIETLHSKTPDHNYNLLVKNNTDKWITLPVDTVVAELIPAPHTDGIPEFIIEDNTVKVTNIHQPCMEHDTLLDVAFTRKSKKEKFTYLPKIYRMQLANEPQLIEKLREQECNDEEIEQKLNDLDRDGYFTHTNEAMAKKIHEVDITPPPADENTTPTIDELLDKIKLDHLPAEQASRFRELFRQNPEVLAKHLWDVEETDCIVAYLPLKDNALSTCTNCKYTSPSIQTTKIIQEALEILEKNKIIQTCTKASPFVSNLLTVK